MTHTNAAHVLTAGEPIVAALHIERDEMPHHFEAVVTVNGLSVERIVSAIAAAQAAVKARVPRASFSGWSRRGLPANGLRLYFHAHGLTECDYCGALGCAGDCDARQTAIADENEGHD